MSDNDPNAIQDDPSLRRGMDLRKVISGGAGSTVSVDDDLYNLIIRYAFGDVWSRPGLEIDTRRLLTFAMTIACGHYEEFKLHVRFALASGMDREIIKEVILHSAVYCGIPAALSAFRHAEMVYQELDRTAD